MPKVSIIPIPIEPVRIPTKLIKRSPNIKPNTINRIASEGNVSIPEKGGAKKAKIVSISINKAENFKNILLLTIFLNLGLEYFSKNLTNLIRVLRNLDLSKFLGKFLFKSLLGNQILFIPKIISTDRIITIISKT